MACTVEYRLEALALGREIARRQVEGIVDQPGAHHQAQVNGVADILHVQNLAGMPAGSQYGKVMSQPGEVEEWLENATSTGAYDVRAAKYRYTEPAQSRALPQILRLDFGLRIGTTTVQLIRLVHEAMLLGPIDRAGGNKHHARRQVASCRLQHVPGTHDAGRIDRIVCLMYSSGGGVHDITHVAHGFRNHHRIANITPDVFDRWMPGFGSRDIQGPDCETLCQEKAAQLGAQKSGSAGHEY